MDLGFEKDKIKQYLLLILRRKELIISVFLVVFGITAVKTYTTVPIYESGANFQIEELTRESSLLGELVKWARYNPLYTEMEIFKSRTIAEEVVKELHLDEVIVEKTPGLDFRLRGLMVNEGERGKVFTVSFSDSPGHFVVTDGGKGAIGEGEVGTPFVGNPISFLLSDSNAKEGNFFRVRVRPLDDVVSELVGGVNIQEMGNQTNLLSVTLKSTSPNVARDALAKWLEVYIRRNLMRRSQEASQALDFIESQLNITKKNLEGAEDEMDTYKTSEQGIVILSEEAEALISKLSDFEKSKVEVTLKEKEIGDLYAALKKGRTSKDFLSSGYIDDPVISNMVSDLTKLLLEREKLLFDYTENHPLVKTLTSQIEGIKRRILDGLETSLKALEKKEKALNDLVTHYDDELKEIPATQRQLARLVRATKVNEDMYTFLLKKHEDARVAKAATISNIRILDPPFLPTEPIEPRKRKNLSVGLFAGILAGLSLAFLLEIMDTTIKTTEEIEKGLSLPLFGVIPAFPFGRGKKGQKEKQRAMSAQYLAEHMESRSPVAEAYRSLRTNIQFGMLKEGAKSFLITSPGPGEGKSTTISHLGMTLAQTHSRVLLLDCDLRKPVLHAIFGVSLEPGVTNVLLGKKSWRDVVKKTQFEGLYVIPGGTIPPNPSELLSMGRLKDILEELKKEYDYIFFDSPPAVIVSDAAILGRILDGVFLVVESEKTLFEAAKKAKTNIETVHAKILGAVFNNLRRSAGYGYYYYPYYAYGYYYGSHDSTPRGVVTSLLTQARKTASRWFPGSFPQ